MALFDLLDVDGNGMITFQEWQVAFDGLDEKGHGAVTRKEFWRQTDDVTLFDSVPRKHRVQITRQEWETFFRRLDCDGHGFISPQTFSIHGFSTFEEDRGQIYRNSRYLNRAGMFSVPRGRDLAKEHLSAAMAKKDVHALQAAICKAARLGINCEKARDVLDDTLKKQRQLKERRALAEQRTSARCSLLAAMQDADVPALEAAIQQGRQLRVGRDHIDEAVLLLTQLKDGTNDTLCVDIIFIPGSGRFRYPVHVPFVKRAHHNAVRDALQAALHSGSSTAIARAMQEACGPGQPMYSAKICRCHHCQLPNDILFHCAKYMDHCLKVEKQTSQEARSLVPAANRLLDEWYPVSLMEQGVMPGRAPRLPEPEASVVCVPGIGTVPVPIVAPVEHQAHVFRVQEALQDAVMGWSADMIARCLQDACGPLHPAFPQKACKCKHCQFPVEVLTACTARMMECASMQHKRSKDLPQLVAARGGQAGRLQVSLLWEDPCDLELIAMVRPQGDQEYQQLCPASPYAAGGRFDLEAGADQPGVSRLQNMHWEDPPLGHYVVCVSLREMVDAGLDTQRSVPFQAQVRRPGGVEVVCGQCSPQLTEVAVFDFTVAQGNRGVGHFAIEQLTRPFLKASAAEEEGVRRSDSEAFDPTVDGFLGYLNEQRSCQRAKELDADGTSANVDLATVGRWLDDALAMLPAEEPGGSGGSFWASEQTHEQAPPIIEAWFGHG